MDHRALDDALEAGGGLRILVRPRGEVGELGIDVLDQVAAQDVEVDVAGAHDGGRIVVVDQCEEQVLQRRVFLAALAREGEGLVKGLFKASGK